jgi:predicted nucleic acid-binding protein
MIVADTNVIAYLALPTAYTEIAERLLRSEPEWVAPVLWRSELRNVLALYLRKSLITFENALAVQSEMENFMQGKEYDISSVDALNLVQKSSCSAYDCEFIALAISLQCKLITMDKEICKAVPDTAVLLTDFMTSGR